MAQSGLFCALRVELEVKQVSFLFSHIDELRDQGGCLKKVQEFSLILCTISCPFQLSLPWFHPPLTRARDQHLRERPSSALSVSDVKGKRDQGCPYLHPAAGDKHSSSLRPGLPRRASGWVRAKLRSLFLRAHLAPKAPRVSATKLLIHKSHLQPSAGPRRNLYSVLTSEATLPTLPVLSPLRMWASHL